MTRYTLSNDLRFLPLWIIVRTNTNFSSERAHAMSEVEREQPQEVTLPIEWHVPDNIQNQYVHNVLVQPGIHEITLFFFETRIPPFVGSPEANREFLLKQGSVRFECISKLTVAPQLVPEIIKALQTGLDNYNASKASEEREASR
jgi:hypothetical protein